MERNLLTSLNELVTDTRFRKLAITQNFENFFNEYGINESQNAYVLSWFLNPNGSHGFKDLFFKEFMTAAWSTIHGSTRPEYKSFKTSAFYNNLSPLSIEQSSWTQAHMDREVKTEWLGADFVITDWSSKTMIVVNNRFDKAECEKASKYFSGKDYTFFENKLFVSFDAAVQTEAVSSWMYMNNEWMINLCSTLLERGEEGKAYGYVSDLYQFLTGTTWGQSAEATREATASLVSHYYQTMLDLKNYKSERFPTKALINVTPREYAAYTQGQWSKMDQEIVSLYWSYRNTFNTFFHAVEFEAVTRDLTKTVTNKHWGFETSFIRNGLGFTPKFAQTGFYQDTINHMFNVELTQDWNKNFCMNLVVNKSWWDKLSTTQRDSIQKNFDWTGAITQDRTTIWSKYYKFDQKGYEFSTEIASWFERIEGYVKTTFTKVA